MKLKTWSYSALSLYEQCPFKYKCSKVDRLPEPESYHLMKGNAAHAVAEAYLLNKIDDVPHVLRKFKNEFINLRKHGAIPEEEITFNAQWQEIPDGWNDTSAWLRLKLDARIGNYLIDFKTGKHYDEHRQQANLYANTHMLRDFDCDSVDVEFWYFDSGAVKKYLFHRKDLESDVAKWVGRVEVMHNDTVFLPKENQWCNDCAFKSICPLFGGKK